jgi:hypothetical protein
MLLRRLYVAAGQFYAMVHAGLEAEILMNKKVISSDLKEVGRIVSINNDSLTILRGADNHYIIPKSRVDASVGNSMLVDFRLNDLLLVELASLSYVD